MRYVMQTTLLVSLMALGLLSCNSGQPTLRLAAHTLRAEDEWLVKAREAKFDSVVPPEVSFTGRPPTRL